MLMLLWSTAPMHAADDLITRQISISVEEPGALCNLVTNEQAKKITNIKLTGKLNVEDLKFIRQMAGCYTGKWENGSYTKYDGVLQHLDISEAQFVGTGTFSVYYKSSGRKADFSSYAIGEYTFAYLDNLKSIMLPSCATSIGKSAFCRCSGLASLALPNSLTSIGNNAFSGCSGLTSLMLPNSLTSIGDRVFFRCI